MPPPGDTPHGAMCPEVVLSCGPLAIPYPSSSRAQPEGVRQRPIRSLSRRSWTPDKLARLTAKRTFDFTDLDRYPSGDPRTYLGFAFRSLREMCVQGQGGILSRGQHVNCAQSGDSESAVR
jgi:hypothetical protein